MMSDRLEYVTLYARLALGAELLSAVADRFGLWGNPGQPRVAWGDWAHFVAYTAQVNSFLPVAWASTLALLATVAEALLGGCLLLGLFTRWTAWATALLMLAFALAMTLSFGPKAALDYSVWADVAVGLFLAQVPNYAWSLDAWRANQHPQARAHSIF